MATSIPGSFLLREDEDINDLNLSRIQKESEVEGVKCFAKANKKVGRKR